MPSKKSAAPFSIRSEEYASRLRAYYDRFSKSEKKIADYLMNHSEIFNKDIAVADLAKLTDSSSATIVRFCRTMGFNGFSEFKFFLQKGLLSHPDSSILLNEHDSTAKIKQKIALHAINSINDSIMVTDNKSLDNAIKVLSEAKQIMICGVGSAHGIAYAAANAFMNLGIMCYVVSDPLTQIRAVGYMSRQDVVLGITNCGYIKDVVDALMVAKKAGATTIALTSIVNSLVVKYADIPLYTTPRTNDKFLDLPMTIICQMITIQVLLIGVLLRKQDAGKEKIEFLKPLSDLKRYRLDLEKIQTGRVTFKKK
jgi:DNA-binding MurR/RpiR family transcriptional regulator